MENNKKGLTDFTNHTDKGIPITSAELEKAKVHIIVKIMEYVSNALMSKTILKMTTGDITISSFDTGEELAEKRFPFDTYIQIIDGAAEVIINEIKHQLKPGEGIIIPANSSHCINSNVQFKIISAIKKRIR